MRKKEKIIITMVTVLALVFVNTSFVHTARAKEDLTIEETLKSQIENMDASDTLSKGKQPEKRVSKNEPQKVTTGEEQSKEEQSREEQSKEETSTGKNGGEIITSEKGTGEETTSEKEQETETVDNSGDSGTFSIQIISDNLPDYVEAVIEKTNVKPFQKALDEFYNQWCEEQEEEYNSEDEVSDDGDWDDEEDSDDEDYDEDNGADDERNVVTYDDEDNGADDERNVVTYDEEDSDNDDLENEEPEGRYLYYHGSNQVLSAYKISFINTRDGSEYEIPEGESVKVKVANEAYDNCQAGGIMNLEEDGSVEMLQFEQSYDDTTDGQAEENTGDTYGDGAANSEGEHNNYGDGATNSKNESSNYDDDNEDLDNEYDEDDDSEYDEDDLEDEDEIYKETVTFDIVHGGKYAILSALVAKTTSDSTGYGREEEENNSMISPKTGVGNGWMAGAAGALALLVVSGYYYRKKEIAKVHKND